MDRLLPRDEPNTDAFADRAVLVLKGSVALTCASAPYRAAALPVCQPCLAASLSMPCFLISPHILPRDADPLLETPCPEKPLFAALGPVRGCGLPAALLRLHSADAAGAAGLGMPRKKRKRPGSFQIGVWLKLA